MMTIVYDRLPEKSKALFADICNHWANRNQPYVMPWTRVSKEVDNPYRNPVLSPLHCGGYVNIESGFGFLKIIPTDDGIKEAQRYY